MTVLRSVTNPIPTILTAGTVIHPDTAEDLPAYQRKTDSLPSTFRQKKSIFGKKIVLNIGNDSAGSYIKQSHSDPSCLNVKLRCTDSDDMYKDIRNLLLSVPMGCVWNFKIRNMGIRYLREDMQKEIGEMCDTFLLDPVGGYENIIQYIKEKVNCDKIGFDGDTIFLKDNKECYISTTPPSDDGSEGTLFLRLADVDKAEDLMPLMEIFDTLLAFFALSGKDTAVQIEDKRVAHEYAQAKINAYAEQQGGDFIEKCQRMLSRVVASIKLITRDVIRWNRLEYTNLHTDKDMQLSKDFTETLFPFTICDFDGTTCELAYYVPYSASHQQNLTRETFLRELRASKIARFKRKVASNHELGRKFYRLIQDRTEKVEDPESKEELLQYLRCIEEVVPDLDDGTKHCNKNGMRE